MLYSAITSAHRHTRHQCPSLVVPSPISRSTSFSNISWISSAIVALFLCFLWQKFYGQQLDSRTIELECHTLMEYPYPPLLWIARKLPPLLIHHCSLYHRYQLLDLPPVSIACGSFGACHQLHVVRSFSWFVCPWLIPVLCQLYLSEFLPGEQTCGCGWPAAEWSLMSHLTPPQAPVPHVSLVDEGILRLISHQPKRVGGHQRGIGTSQCQWHLSDCPHCPGHKEVRGCVGL